jgi:hypothetical protein
MGSRGGAARGRSSSERNAMKNNVHDNPYWKEVIRKREIEQYKQDYIQLSPKDQAKEFLYIWWWNIPRHPGFSFSCEALGYVIDAIMFILFGRE